jgi:hypothetical protein
VAARENTGTGSTLRPAGAKWRTEREFALVRGSARRARRERQRRLLSGLDDERRAGRHLVPEAGKIAERLGDDRARRVGELLEPLVPGMNGANGARVGGDIERS